MIDLDLLFGKQKGKKGSLIFFARTVLTKAVELKTFASFIEAHLKNRKCSKMERGKDLKRIGLFYYKIGVYVIVFISGGI